MSTRRIALIGFGEVGQVFGADLAGNTLSAFDLLFHDGASQPSLAVDASPVRRAASASDCIMEAEIVISAVTANQSEEAARSAAAYLAQGTWYLDVNSVAPDTRQAAAAVIDDAGGRYVEAAIMSPISPRRVGSPILLGGPHAKGFAPLAQELGFSGTRFYDEHLGRASATKLCRSVIVKGLEAIVTEAMLAARHYGVEQEVTGSLTDLSETADWWNRAEYLIGRSLRHGARRAAEMREAARTVENAGLPALMSSACADRQALTGLLQTAMDEKEFGAMLDSMNQQQKGGMGSC